MSRATEGRDLLPCPFCGYQPAFGTVTYGPRSDEARLNGQQTFHYVNCPACGVNNQGIIGHKTPEGAARRWNRRAAPPAETTEPDR